jgi:error-prone DNA polymerase
MGYVELHAHSAYSFLDGASTPDELVAAAAVHGYPAVALTDHDGIWGAMEFAHVCKGVGIRAIIGAELTLDDGSHLTLLVEDRTGYRNLCRLLTLAHEGTRAWCSSEEQRRSSRGRRGGVFRDERLLPRDAELAPPPKAPRAARTRAKTDN